MDATLWGPVVGAAGAVAGYAVARVTRAPGRRDETPGAGDAHPAVATVADIVHVLRSAAVLLDAGDTVLVASPSSQALGLVRGRDLVHAELRGLARAARRDGAIQEERLALPRGLLGTGTLQVQARVAPLAQDHVLLLVEDQTQAQRVEDVRRDFVANVSHELKTPVGGISLLAEAVVDASDDPEAVRRFAARIRTESTRLARLVQEIVELSRLQASESLSDPVLVPIAPVVWEAVERVHTLAEAKGMTLAVAADETARVYGDADMLGTAVDNLLTNAINYSGAGTRVAVGVRQARGIVEITVADQGQGIPADDLDRIFERFYRVDPARSRATGGTGLGLAIVKHICVNHGGEVTVWSEEGRGSTFTVRLPAAAEPADAEPPYDARPAGESTYDQGRPAPPPPFPHADDPAEDDLRWIAAADPHPDHPTPGRHPAGREANR